MLEYVTIPDSTATLTESELFKQFMETKTERSRCSYRETIPVTNLLAGFETCGFTELLAHLLDDARTDENYASHPTVTLRRAIVGLESAVGNLKIVLESFMAFKQKHLIAGDNGRPRYRFPAVSEYPLVDVGKVSYKGATGIFEVRGCQRPVVYVYSDAGDKAARLDGRPANVVAKFLMGEMMIRAPHPPVAASSRPTPKALADELDELFEEWGASAVSHC